MFGEVLNIIIGIKHDFLCINICWAPREMLKPEPDRLGKRELICLLSFTCNYVVSVRKCFLFLWVLGMGCVILLWHSLNLLHNYFSTSPEGPGRCFKKCIKITPP